MGKKKLKEKNENISETKIKEINSLEYGRQSMKAYGSYTLEQRALPDFRDGLKPVHRRVLWSCYKLGVFSHKPTTKCARIVGDTIAKYHPHGDIPVYDGLVTMVASFQEGLLHGQGNFGNKILGDGPAAYRYTETRLTEFTEKYLLDPNYLAVLPMIPNYDGKDIEPVYLPGKLPLSLVHSIEGIATGASVNIVSFSVESLTKAVILALQKGKVTPKDCYKLLKFRFREGGIVVKDKSLIEFFKTGHGSIKIYPTVHYDSKLNAAIMTSYVPRFKIEHIQKALDIKEVKDVEDLSSLHKKGKQNSKKEIKILFKFKKEVGVTEGEDLTATIQEKFACNMPANILVTNRHDNGEDVEFKYSNPSDIINEWLTWRIGFEKKVVDRLIAIEEEKIQKLSWLTWAIDNLDLVFKGLKTKDPDNFLVKKGEITQEHAKYIYDQQTRRFRKLEKNKLKDEIIERTKVVKAYKADIKNNKTISKRILKQLDV